MKENEGGTMKKWVFGFFIVLLMQLSNFIAGAIPAEERAALIALYNSTGGDNWTKNSGWKTPPLHTDGFAMPGTEGSWYGVTLSGDNVYSIKLDWHNLSGSIPAELGNLSSMYSLDFYNNHLSGSIPAELSYLSNLGYLNLSNNQLSGSIPSQLGNLSSLYSLDLYNNQLSGSIPPELGNLSNLQSLKLGYNQLSGSIPAELGSLSYLKLLWMNNNQLSGSIPPELGNLSNLEELSLGTNQLSGSIPPELGNLSKLHDLFLGFNQLSGSIPPELGNLSNLEMLQLYYNQLNGSIPAELGKISNLYRLNLNNNQLSGSIPPELGNLSHLGDLCLHHNQLSGSIPPELGNLHNLYNFILGGNQLSGSIPPELGNLCYIYGLGLSHNQLIGSIPPGFINFANITDLDVGYNCLSASDPKLRAWLNSHDPDWKATQCLEKVPPFGNFETPNHNSTVCSSIPVTGWALDDYGMDSVKIYCVQEQNLVFIGDAIFVKGARPDVEAAYPGYPGNDSAGWGYMLLTNGLPNGGNGTYVLQAIATDIYGKTTTLGTKTIIVDNIHAVKPFGAIDMPAQGGTASGSRFFNTGWVLTPMPNLISLDGSTINVWLDGLDIGHPTYGIYRKDIAAIFPGYSNSDNAGAQFILDTIGYADGLHTISWTAIDNAGNLDGIGSRYFEILNTDQNAATSGSKEIPAYIPQDELACIPLDYTGPVTFKRGFARESVPQTVYPADNGITSIAIEELERVVIHLSGTAEAGNLEAGSFTGYQAIGDRLAGLPVGSTLDRQGGIFYWTPGPGFIGTYSLIFFNRTGDKQKKIEITILPKN